MDILMVDYLIRLSM